MNRYGAIGAVVAMVAGYWVGWGHGHDAGAYESKPVERIVYAESPYTSTCATMLEAAWAIEDTAPAGSPHKP